MPEVVTSWVTYKDMEKVNKIQDSILKSYENDFSKHTSNIKANRISIIWNSIPSQISKENKKFLYQVAKDGARAREYESALNWLKDANVVNKIYNVTKPNMPLISYNDLSSFKMYLNDIGLLRKKTDLDSKVIVEGNRLFNKIIPIEVKSGENINNTSLKIYNEMNQPKTRIRFSMKNLNKDGNLINLPLFMVEYLDKLINL